METWCHVVSFIFISRYIFSLYFAWLLLPAIRQEQKHLWNSSASSTPKSQDKDINFIDWIGFYKFMVLYIKFRFTSLYNTIFLNLKSKSRCQLQRTNCLLIRVIDFIAQHLSKQAAGFTALLEMKGERFGGEVNSPRGRRFAFYILPFFCLLDNV